MTPHCEKKEDIADEMAIIKLSNVLKYSSMHYLLEFEDIWKAEESTKKKLLSLCKQKKAKMFSSVIATNYFLTMSRVGVGSYSEVYSAINDNREKVVYKIIPVENKSGTNRVSQKSKSALSDLIITKTLNSLRSGSFEQASHYCENFTNLRGLNYVISEVDRLQCDGNSVQEENRRRKTNYKYLICEMADDGIPLHNKKSLTPKEGIAICAQILAAFSVAESAVQFEHRDFHTNNILLTLTEAPSLKYKLNNHTFEIPVYKWKVTIIDFTFSRLTIGKEDTPIYTDLQKLKISELKNSSLSNVYNLQRKALKGSWDHYNPKTNIYWVEFIFKEVLKRVDNYWSSVGVHSKCITSDFYQMLQSWKDTISEYDSCLEFSKATRVLE